MINKYPSRVGVAKSFFENIRYILRRFRLFFVNGFKNRTILFYPDMPSKKAVAYKIMRRLNYNITNNRRQGHTVAIHWKDETLKRDFNLKIPAEVKVNFGCLDISKVKVDEVFKSIFGYSTFIDPLRHVGFFVQKSDENAKHDGVILKGPIQDYEVSSNHVYQIIIDNTVEGGLVLDYRIPVFKDLIPFVYKKYRPEEERFSNTNSRAEIVEVAEVFSDEEVSKILQFVNAMELDYGELDILRDNNSGLIYIIDVSTTPWGPPNHLPAETANVALTKLCRNFKETFFEK